MSRGARSTPSTMVIGVVLSLDPWVHVRADEVSEKLRRITETEIGTMVGGRLPVVLVVHSAKQKSRCLQKVRNLTGVVGAEIIYAHDEEDDVPVRPQRATTRESSRTIE